MKRITLEVDDKFAEKFSNYCLENNKTKKSVIMDLISKETNNGIMKQYDILDMDKEHSTNFINEDNYKRLSKLEIEDKEPWIMRSNLSVNKNINKYFEKDETLASINNFLQASKTKNLSFPNRILDHYYFVKFNKNHTEYDFEYLYGIMSFPYMDFESLQEIISSWNTDFWNLYIINPILMRYQKGNGLGLFITPVNYEFVIDEYNGFFETLTGYKLFYLWTNNDKIPPIIQNKKLPNISDWCNILKENEKDFPKMYQKIVKFWYNNEDIKCHALENSYYQFTHKMPYDVPFLLSLTLEGPAFKMVNTRTGWTTGKCNKLSFDLKTFKCIDVDRKEVKFTEEMLKDFKDGNFELKMI